MPRRVSARTATQNHVPVQSEPSSALIPPQSLPENLVILRKQWKWAAFSQFFFTFSPLFNMDDVTLKDVEDDLYLGSSLVIPRIIVRLLYTLSYDRKVNLNNWQTTLRRQYNKRDPAANPIGPEPIKDETDSVASPEPEPESTKMEEDVDETSTREHSMSVLKDEVKSENGSMPPTTRKTTTEEPNEEPPSDDAPEQESRDWMSLSMLDKLDSLHLLTEWQFQSPHRVRTLMKTEDDQASWRIEPIGYDAKRNAYWLIGADRLWIQRASPKNSLKRKRATGTKTQTKTSSPSKRPRLQSTPATKKSKAAVTQASGPTGGRRGRAAKDQAKIKLDQQAKQLAELNRQASLLDSSPNRRSSVRGAASLSKAAPPSPSRSGSRTTRASASARPLGTRLSSRLRGSLDDEWQAIPNEWLHDEDEDEYESDSKGKEKARGKFPTPPRSLAGSSISELTELSEEREEEEKEEENEKEEEEDEEDEKEDEKEQEEPKVEKADEPERPILDQKKAQDQASANFVEWETIAVTLNDWENVAERWQNATHYSEKSLYKILTKRIIPIITEELREIEAKLQEIENQRQKEEAVNHRKRSSRLAIKESEREEARLAAKKKVEESEKMSRAKRLEARQQKEEAERARRESAREQRLKEREAKDEQEAREAEEKERQEKEKAEKAKPRPQRGSKAKPNYTYHDMSDEMSVQLHHPSSSNASSFNGSARASTRGSRTPAGDDWELDCEICLRRGINLDDGLPLMCCGSCAKWQHIPCHDRADAQAGRPRRNWDQVDFVCRQCRANRMNASSGYSSNGVQMQYSHPPASMNTHPPLHSQHSVAPAPFNHQVPYGQGLGGYDPGSGSTAHMSMSNGYANMPAVNGTRNSKGYGTSNLRSSVPATQAPEFGPTAAGQSLTFSHYQPQQRDYYPNPPTVTVYDQQQSRDSPVATYDQRTRNSPVDQRLPHDSPVAYDQRSYRDSPAAYRHTNQSYGHYEGHNNPRNLSGWNGAPANHSLGYSQPSSTSTYMPNSAERSSVVVPESSSRHLHLDQPPNHYPQQQRHHPHQQQQQQWLRQGVPQAHMPFAASSASFQPHHS
ncbi:hypothetical protein BDP27DRAFT_1329180 [Rhodocollybia butyracea]|uniref:Zinc finger PHD-type domain-containing protein n=1 Tax=Rhodocollybia butyracea TaxID=206335 RepID=A0A9P5PQ71_9AGAR|nr:hypothetical protein BDP27DRAFT_1329180 [Rhodocollybia butyracea]